MNHIDSSEVFFELLGRQIHRAKERGWLDDDHAAFFGQSLARAKSSFAQFSQDLWVLYETQDKRDGYFVEFGATDGILRSNTYLLESTYGWRGILAEPNPAWSGRLKTNRPTARISTDCVWTKSGERLSFSIPEDPELAAISAFASGDMHAQQRSAHRAIDVTSISLNDLLTDFHAPPAIDYMSIDTEGSEYEILRNFDFRRWDVSLLSIEHNHSANEGRLDRLLEEMGYERRFPGLSHVDGWYRKRRSAAD